MSSPSSGSTLVVFHAHPDDESITTGGVMAQAADAGHRVVLVVATRGELGRVPDGLLDAGETLGERRVAETHLSAKILGAQRVEFLEYHDSGMMQDPHKNDPACFWKADVDEAAVRLASLLQEENADTLVIYDENGNYGHPDHIQVHRVGARAAALAGTQHIFEATINRDHMLRMVTAAQHFLSTDKAAEKGMGSKTEGEETQDVSSVLSVLSEMPDLPDAVEFPDPGEMGDTVFGMPEDRLTTCVDVTAWLDRKRASMAAHASQIGQESYFLALPDPLFQLAFGSEWFIRHGTAPGLRESSILPPFWK